MTVQVSLCQTLSETPKTGFLASRLWGIQGYTFFLILLKNIYCGYSLEPPRLLVENKERCKSKNGAVEFVMLALFNCSEAVRTFKDKYSMVHFAQL